MRPTFKYKPLNTSSNEIRLIRILPGTDPEELNCSLIHVSMDEDPQYNALSYAWREPTVFSPEELSSTEILVVSSDKQRLSGKTMSRAPLLKIFLPCLQIGKNLAAFLRSARSPETASGLIWVDAICINQKDIKERNVQVQRMRDIFKNAREVLVWLGPQGLDSALAYDHIRMLYCNHEADDGDQVRSREPDYWSNDEIIWLKDTLKAGTQILGWKALSNLLDRSWWYRIWATQEVVVAKSVTVICGPCKLEWQILEFVLENIGLNWDWINDMLLRSQFYTLAANAHGMYTARHTVNLRWASDANDFLRILYATHTRSCSDMRDKVYGILGLAADAQAIVPSPDYSLSIVDVYMNLAVSMIETREDLDYLLLAGNLPLGEQRNPSMPSWCPDLSRGKRVISMNTSVKPHWSKAPAFQAAGHSRPATEFQIQLGILKVKGFCLDIIDGLGAPWSEWFSDEEWGRAVVQPRHQRSIYGTDENTYHAIWKTTIGGRNALMQGDYAELFARQCCILEGSYQENSASNSPGKEHAEFQRSEDFHHWYLHSRSMTFGGKTLQLWAETFDLCIEKSRRILHPTQHEPWQKFKQSFSNASCERRVVTTEKGYFGMVPEQTSRGDIVCILLGGRMPIILRPVGLHWEFIGECYIHGVMYGEAMDHLENGLYKLREFEIH